MASKVLRLLVVGSLAGVLVACGDDTPANPDSSVPMADGGTDAGELPDDDAGSDAGTDGGTEPLPEPTVIALSTTGHDRLYAVARDADGNIYATGQMSDSIEADADFSLMVAKFSPEGVLDTTFGEDGIASVNVAEGGGDVEVARGIVVQSTGRIVIAGTAENDPTIGEAGNVLRRDTDVVLVGFTAAGVLDDAFGDAGIARLELNDGVVTQNMDGDDVLNGADAQWGLALGASDTLVVHGTQRADGDQPDGEPRTDSIWVVARLTSAGELDTTFSTDGIVTLDLVGDASGNVTADRLGARASARAVSVLPDGSIVASGYLTSTLLTTAPATTQQPVIYKILPTGEFDAAFAADDATVAPGVWYDLAVAPPLRAEAYGAALQGDRLVTMGYGPTRTEGVTTTDWISLRFEANGALDETYGTEGITYVDVAELSDNGRFVMTLADDRVVGLGTGRLAPPAGGTAERDSMIVVLTEDGLADTSFAENGTRLYDLGGDNDGFHGGVLSPDESTVAIVGVAGGEADTDDDDSVLFLLPVD